MGPFTSRLLVLLSLVQRQPLVAGQGMDDLMRIAEEVKQEMAAEQAAKAQKERGYDTVDMLENSGIAVTKEKTEEIRNSPDKARDAYMEAVAETTQLVIYKEVRCEGCQLAAELLASHLVESWKASWDEEKVLERVQLFCESEAFPQGRQALIPDKNPEEPPSKEGEAAKEGEEKPKEKSKEEPKSKSEQSETPDTYVSPLDRYHGYAIEKSDAEVATTPFSLVALRRICSEGVFEHDTDIAENAVAVMAKSGEQAERQAKLQKKYEKLMCSRACKAKKSKGGKKPSAEL